MFGQRKHSDDADSDSDWDSLTGDPEPPSDAEPTPRLLQPAPPATNNSPRTPVQNKRLVQHGAPSNSKPSSPSTAEIKKTPISSPTNRASQLYGKTGLTNFVDRGQSATTFSDRGGIDSTRNVDLPLLETKSSKPKERTVGRKMEGINNNGLDLNELDFNPSTNNPPYTDFKGALPKNEIPLSKEPEQKKGKIKNSYIRGPTPDLMKTERQHSNASWDENELEEDPRVYGSTQQLAVTPRQSNDKHALAKSSSSDEAVGLDVEKGVGYLEEGEACCVPYQKTQGTGYHYVFHHGRNQYLNVTPEWREPYMKSIGERFEKWMKYFWQEFFGALGLVVDFVLIFLLELIRFILRKVLLRLLSGVIVMFSDNLLKPYLTVAFNSFVQPMLIFMWNVLAGLRNAVNPFLDITREIIAQLGSLLRSFRLFELNWKPVINGGNTIDNSLALSHHRIHEV